MLFNTMYSLCYFEPHFQHCSQTEIGKSSSKYKRRVPVGFFLLYCPSTLVFLNASLPFIIGTSHGLKKANQMALGMKMYLVWTKYIEEIIGHSASTAFYSFPWKRRLTQRAQ